MTEQSKVIPVEAQAVPDLHQQIMNLPLNIPSSMPYVLREAYAEGHRDARHAAAQLVAASPAAAADPHQVPPPVFRNGQWEGRPISEFPALQAEIRGLIESGELSVNGASSPVAPVGAPTESQS